MHLFRANYVIIRLVNFIAVWCTSDHPKKIKALSVDGPLGNYPLAVLTGERSNVVEVAVVMKEGQSSFLSSSGDKQIGNLSPTLAS